MGLFSKIFGSGGSDKADAMRQKAIDAFNAIKSPELSRLQIQLDKYVQAGQLTPEQAEAQLLSSNAFNDIVVDPTYVGAQKQALQQLQQIGTEGGLNATDRSQIQDITDEQNQIAKGRNDAILSSAKERGTGNAGITTVNQLINEQEGANRAAKRGTDVAANAEARALAAMQAAGQTAGQIRGQDYAEAAKKAEAENAIDKFNKETLNQTNLYNVQAKNLAQAANLANEQSVLNANTSTANSEKEYNAKQVQQQYDNAMNKAKGEAGVFTDWAKSAQDQAEKERNASAGLIQGALQSGATAIGGAFGGPVGAAAASSATTPHAAPSYAPQNEDEIGMGFSEGGEVPGKAAIPHNSPKNDVVNAKLSPGEVVVPLDAQNDDAEFEAFMQKFKPSNRKKELHVPTEAKAIADLHNRLSALEGN